MKSRGLFICSICFLMHSFYTKGQGSLYTSGTFTKTVNTALPVGTIGASADVDLSGAATYTIPIAVPPGTNGVQPSLAIVYNSMAGNGILGQGWSLSGLSAITRVSKDIYHDGTANPVDYSANDRFALDGQRLVGVSGTYGAHLSTYATETESFAVITSYQGTFSGPGYFTVQQKNGVMYEYGNSADAITTNATGTHVMIWRLNKITYQDGNYIQFTYAGQSSEPRILEINYTGNTAAGLLPYNKVAFNYLSRSDQNTVYMTGVGLYSTYFLDNITITGEGSAAFKTYKFNYGWDNINSYLTEVIEKGSDGIQLNSTIFKYGDQQAVNTSVTTTTTGAQNANFFSGDFDGDGRTDLVEAATNINNGVEYTSQLKLFSANTSGTFNGYVLKGLAGNFSTLKKKDIPDVYTFYTNDFTGDGIDDIAAVKTTGFGSTWDMNFVRIYKGAQNSLSFSDSITINAYTGYSRINPTTQNYIFSGDFNGDGVGDLLTMLGLTSAPSTIGVHMYFGGISSGFGTCNTTGTINIAMSTWPTADRIQVLDFNGDGKSDLMVTKGNFTEIYTFDGWTARSVYYAGYPTSANLVFYGDFNGDRKMDILSRADKTNNASAWSVYSSTGVAFTSTAFTFALTPDINSTYSPDRILTLDMNGDGKTDIFYAKAGSFPTVYLHFSKGNSFYLSTYTNSYALNTMPQTAFDVNGDGKSDLISRPTNTSPFNVMYFFKDGKELYLEKVKNGFDHNTSWTYNRMNEGGSFYGRGAILTGKINNINLPMALASSLNVDNGIGSTNTTSYAYEEAKLHKEGRGMLGFLRNISYNQTTGFKTINENEFETTSYFTAAPKLSTIIYNPLTQQMSQNTFTNSWVSTGSGRFYQRVNNLSENKTFEGQTVNTALTYDAYANVTGKTVNVQSGLEISTTTTAYGQFGTPVPALPTSVTVTTTRSGQTAYSVTNTAAYNSLSQVTSKVDFSGLPKAVTTTYAYNNLGNQTSARISASGITSRNKFASTYDSKGRWAVTTTTPVGTTSTTYSSLWGKPTFVTDIMGLQTTFSYDAFGREISMTTPQFYTVNTSYNWTTSYGARYYKQVTHPYKPDIKIYNDVLDRERRTETEGWQSQWITTEKTYTYDGQLATTTSPYKTGETGMLTTFNYDIYRRLSSTVENKAGTNYTTTLGYTYSSGNLTTTTTNPANQVSSKVSDAAGKTSSATDYGGTLSYTYFSHGGLNTVSNGSTLITNAYDAYARQASMVDINAGTTTYDYDALGQLTTQVNAKSQTHTMTYDTMGRILTKTMPEGTTTYEYYQAGTYASIGKIKKITGFSGDLQEYTYDGFGNLSTDKQTVDGVAHTKTYTYDATYSYLNTLTYPSGFVLNYTYDGNGYLSTITNGGAVTLFTNGTMNGYNQYKTYSLGNGKSSTNTYFFGIPTNYATAGIQNLTMNWDYTSGNLTCRVDGILGKTETFGYDNLNRLTSSVVTGLTTYTTAYATNGNITSKTDAGTYTYGGVKINAVTQINPSAGNISTVSQSLPTYTSYLQPSSLTEGTNTLNYTYGADENRIKGVLVQSGTTTNTRYFFGDYEKDITGASTKHIHYINAGDGLMAIVIRENGTDTYYYTYTDHLGSILSVTNNAGTVIQNQNFDAWGRYRNATNWTYTGVVAPPAWLTRGFTGHEHLSLFGLINMNGRLYDPVVGRMLAVDNNVSDAGSTQGFNRYGYALNNPLKYTDPDGEWVHIVIGALIGGTANLIIKGFQGKIHNIGDFGKAFGIGALAGAVTAATGGAAGVFAQTGSFVGAFSYSAVTTASSGLLGGAIVGGVGSAFGSPILGVGNQIAFNDPYSTSDYRNDILFGAALGAASGQLSKWLSKNKPTSKPNIRESNPPGKLTGLKTSLWKETVSGGGCPSCSGSTFESVSELNELVVTAARVNDYGELLDDLIRDAQLRYPNLAGKTQLHHTIPQYLGGAKNQSLVPLDAAYHQQITNAFRAEWGYGLSKPSQSQLLEILKKVYGKYPIP